jgi:predicted  nucleic acid-binding Zn-ribbon protein
MATVAEIQSELDAARSILGNLETQLGVINNQTLDVNKQLKAARAAGDTAAANALSKTYQNLTNQSMVLDDKIRAESSRINALVRGLNDAKEAAEEIVKNENEGEPSPWYFDYKIYEESNG